MLRVCTLKRVCVWKRIINLFLHGNVKIKYNQSKRKIAFIFLVLKPDTVRLFIDCLVMFFKYSFRYAVEWQHYWFGKYRGSFLKLNIYTCNNSFLYFNNLRGWKQDDTFSKKTENWTHKNSLFSEIQPTGPIVQNKYCLKKIPQTHKCSQYY